MGRKLKKIAIWSAIILGSNVAGLYGHSVWGSASWALNKTGSMLTWVSNIGHHSKG